MPRSVLLVVLAGCSSAPRLLSESGLYASGASGALADGVVAYAPRFELWSDGATKRRFLSVPGPIDSSDADFWSFPEGTKAWKEFSVDGRAIETRLLWKDGPDPEDWVMAAYLWDEDGSDARRALRGEVDALGTSHDVPSQEDCHSCHDGLPDRLAGVSAIQLDHDGEGETLATLVAADRLSDPPAAPLTLPGDAVDEAALGALHANCGICHNAASASADFVAMELWLTAADLATVEATPAWRTAVGVEPLQDLPPGMDAAALIAPGDPVHSLILQRMSVREKGQMPPIGSETVDYDAVAAIAGWIVRMP